MLACTYAVTTISLATGDPALVLDMVTLSAIYSGRVYRWDDAAIAALNPTLASRGKLPAVNITLVVANAGDRFEQRTSSCAPEFIEWPSAVGLAVALPPSWLVDACVRVLSLVLQASSSRR